MRLEQKVAREFHDNKDPALLYAENGGSEPTFRVLVGWLLG